MILFIDILEALGIKYSNSCLQAKLWLDLDKQVVVEGSDPMGLILFEFEIASQEFHYFESILIEVGKVNWIIHELLGKYFFVLHIPQCL
jgi:hypothetical protein